MKRILLLKFIVFVICGTAAAQNISKAAVLSDLGFLNRAAKYAHPVNYQSVGKVNIDNIVSRVSATSTDSISAVEYRFLLGSALQEIGCVHTNVRKNPTIKLKAGTPHFFPLRVQIIGDEIFTLNQPDSLKAFTGKQVASINGVPCGILVKKFLQFSASDGGGEAFVRGQMSVVLESVIALYFSYPETYSVQFTESSVPETLKASPLPLTDSLAKMPLAALKNRKNALYIDGDRAYLKVDGFHLSDKRFFRKMLKHLKQDSISDLILDLRNNTGGNRKAAVVLTQQLTDSVFQYRIVESKLLEPRNYLPSKGRRQMKLAWVHYHIFDCFKHSKIKNGHAFTYRYKPAKNPFRGKIYVLQSGLTASSSTMVTSWLSQYSDAVFIGSKSAGGYNGNNGGSFPTLVLPGTGMEIKFPVYRLILDPESENAAGLDPEYQVNYTLKDYLERTDKELEKAIELIK